MTLIATSTLFHKAVPKKAPSVLDQTVGDDVVGADTFSSTEAAAVTTGGAFFGAVAGAGIGYARAAAAIGGTTATSVPTSQAATPTFNDAVYRTQSSQPTITDAAYRPGAGNASIHLVNDQVYTNIFGSEQSSAPGHPGVYTDIFGQKRVYNTCNPLMAGPAVQTNLFGQEYVPDSEKTPENSCGQGVQKSSYVVQSGAGEAPSFASVGAFVLKNSLLGAGVGAALALTADVAIQTLRERHT
jgi:hypothetical protein